MDVASVVGGTDPRVFHFTHIDNLPSIIEYGLLADTVVRRTRTFVEAGDLEVKARRRIRPVPVGTKGFVGDYVPFYFAPRSPMLFKIACGEVPTYDQGQESLAYLVSRLSVLGSAGCSTVVSSVNAAHRTAAFTDDLRDLDAYVDWPLMRARDWRATDADPQRMARRMAELLVWESVPWTAIVGVAVRSKAALERARAVLNRADAAASYCDTRPGWYFEGKP